MRAYGCFFICLFVLLSACAPSGLVKEHGQQTVPKTSVIKTEEADRVEGLRKTPLITQIPLPATKVGKVPKIIATFQTKLLDRDKNRIHNLEVASKKLLRCVLKQNQVFSFNEVVGVRDAKHGYREAIILVDGEKEEGIGGGICQLSSTLFNAAQLAGFSILERHNHSGAVHYVPLGKDAAVSDGYEDFKFQNNGTTPIRFMVSIGPKYLTVMILVA